MNYIKQLDSVRAIAVLLVIITHWFPETNQLNIYTSVFNGVDIFFVLSGFLITRILLQNRLEAESSVVTKSTVVKNFFVRRILRIFPIYYLLIFFCWHLHLLPALISKTAFLIFSPIPPTSISTTGRLGMACSRICGRFLLKNSFIFFGLG